VIVPKFVDNEFVAEPDVVSYDVGITVAYGKSMTKLLACVGGISNAAYVVIILLLWAILFATWQMLGLPWGL
jgi:hypothetical protein